MPLPTPFQSGARLIDGDELNNAIGYPDWANNPGITALAGGGRTGAPVLMLGLNSVTTVASGNDSVVLPRGNAGSVVVVANAGANAMQVFANGSDTINGTAGATGISVANAKRIMFFAVAQGVWFSILTA